MDTGVKRGYQKPVGIRGEKNVLKARGNKGSRGIYLAWRRWT